MGRPGESRRPDAQSCVGRARAPKAMITYADSSALIAWFHPQDEFALQVTLWVKENVTDFVWNPILRAEVRHNLRKIRSSYARTAWNALRASEKGGRLSYGREKLQDLLEHADDL